VIPSEKLADFFFMDDDEERKQYGETSGGKMAQATLSAAQLVRDKQREEALKFKQIQDFKVKVLDFIAIYIKETKKTTVTRDDSMDTLDIIKGLLKGLQVAHTDRNAILFERIKTVISMMARGHAKAGAEEAAEDAGIKENKIVMTELMGQLLRHSKD
jgi:hypothetical protein